ncbi:GAL1 [Candida pseudojiufengensis]|uniref:GAL1 n=1 Tax=Candida pseudojiufengensis TaxID=497109 RepID=UPI0022248B54|nr:GAL1 [Candida pseudojiufengensis]KAI5959577.1 GAL1 [Candida pseudojiufengensis]
MSLIPIFKDLSFYSNPSDQKVRYDELTKTFKTNFSDEKIDFIARSPGRVNLIGDHIDYNYFPVLPMAIEVDVIAAVSINNRSNIIITNTDPSFKKYIIDLPSDLENIDNDIKMDENHSWGNYFKCGLIVASKFIKETTSISTLKGMSITFNGTVPTGGGLSSSAAFCVASTLAILYANGISKITKSDLTRITVVSEHYVGLNNGGMDQCASIYGEQGKALQIQFKPVIKGIPFSFPVNNIVFLITNSLQVSNKQETAPFHYNLRVVEMAISSDLLAKKLKLDEKNLVKDSNIGGVSLRGVMEGFCGDWEDDDVESGITNLNKMIEVVELNLTNKEGYSVDEICKEFQITPEEFKSKYLTKFPVQFDKLKLYQRSLHVYKESLRVLKVIKLLSSNSTNAAEFFNTFGQLMNESQQDLTQLNESSNTKLNDICSIALTHGSFGSRVTGAGWGGSIVHLTNVEKLPNLVDNLRSYYKQEFPNITDDELNDAIIDSKPGMGSCIIELD